MQAPVVRLSILLALVSLLVSGCSDTASTPNREQPSSTSASTTQEAGSTRPTPIEPSVPEPKFRGIDENDGHRGETTPAPDTAGQPPGTQNIQPTPTRLPEDLLAESKLTPLNKQNTVLMDFAGKRVLLKTNLCLNVGMLEMFLTIKQIKEHESILSIDSKAETIHAALIALGAIEGHPAKYEPKYEPATGPKIGVFVHWVDSQGKLHRQAAQSWVRESLGRFHQEKFDSLPADLKIEPDSNLRYDETNKYLIWYGPMTSDERVALLKLSRDDKYQKSIQRFFEQGKPKQMAADWVFVGSGFADDGKNGKQYLAEGGYVICLANFSMSMIDVSIESSAAGNESLNFEAWTERLPPKGSEVLVELVVSE